MLFILLACSSMDSCSACSDSSTCALLALYFLLHCLALLRLLSDSCSQIEMNLNEERAIAVWLNLERDERVNISLQFTTCNFYLDHEFLR